MVEIVVKFKVDVGDIETAIHDSKFMGKGKPSLLKYIRWLANEEGLLGIIEDDYTITSAKPIKDGE